MPVGRVGRTPMSVFWKLLVRWRSGPNERFVGDEE